jgi:hypothetical protein
MIVAGGLLISKNFRVVPRRTAAAVRLLLQIRASTFTSLYVKT